MWLPRLLPTEPRMPTMAVCDAELTVGGCHLPLPGDMRTLVRMLGKPSAVWNLTNTLSVWDELGLVAYQPPGGGPVFSLAIVLSELMGHGFWPRRQFPGRLTLDGAVVTADSTIDGINATKAGARLTPAGGGCCWEINYGDIVVGVNKAKDGYFAADGAIAELVLCSQLAEPSATANPALKAGRGR